MSAPSAAPHPRYAIRGPSALGGDWRRFVYLTVTLAVTEFKLRFYGSLLGYVWQLIRPLMLFGILLLVFTVFLDVGDVVPHYPAVLLTNVVLFAFFAEATAGAVPSVVDRENLVRKIQFPRLAIPLSVVFTAMLNLLVIFIAVVIFLVASGIEPTWDWLQVPVLVGLLVLFAIGLAMILSALFVRFRDVRPIWEVTLQGLFYATPVIYAIEVVDIPARARELIMLHPLAAILQQMRHALIDQGAPTAAAAAGGYARLLIPAAILFGSVAIGFWLFNREAPRIAEDL